jgi:diadenosine tetraphosphatase ApaH/serine/threonine PP2A family protein phosphatase
MWAILSDIHANLEALQAVAADIERHNVERVICLGDLIGFGPNPCECVDWAMGCDVTLKGYYDESVFGDLELLNSSANQALSWTRSTLQNADDLRAKERVNFLRNRPLRHFERDNLFVHDSPRHRVTDWLFPEDVYNPRKLDKIFHLVTKHCFHGNSHVPGIFTEEPQYFAVTDDANMYRLDVNKTLVNVGSVGQPRDGDPRACYVLLDDDLVTFRRIEYDIRKTRDKIHAIPELDNYLGDRLLEGR